MKKFRIVLACLIISLASAAVFAYDGTVETCRELGTTSYSEFIESFDDDCVETTRAFLNNTYDGELDRIFLVDSEKVDDEDSELLDDLENYLENEMEATVNTIYQTLVVRTNNRKTYDGWVVYSQFTKKNGWVHYMVYFAY